MTRNPSWSKEEFAKELKELQGKFLKHRSQYKERNYNETDVRNEFLNRMFIALGWDVENRRGTPPSEREVLMERGDCQGKRPDYNFRIEGATRFYLEAKAPHVSVKNPEFIHQAKSYSWSTTESLVPLAVLSNFEETLIYDTTLVPDFEYPERGLIFECKVEDLHQQQTVDKLWMLSKGESASRSLEQVALRNKRIDSFRVRPDARLLDILNGYRLDLAASIFTLNKGLDLKHIEDVVSTVVHRLLFMRVLEDRETIDRRELKEVVDSWEEASDSRPHLLPMMLKKQFAYINENFNGKLFDGDPLEGLNIDSNALAKVIRGLYGRNCPFAFNRLDVSTLGHIYEQFLSRELAKSGRGVRLKERPWLRKSEGVFYTPKKIVKLICEEAVGPILTKIKDVSEMRLLDPACGSGTFLITGYQMLLAEEARRLKCLVADVPFIRKRDLLLKCIFGVDIDKEATKVAVLSLCLAALEGEPHISKGKRLLPNLRDNILCADSLMNEPYSGRKGLDTAEFPKKGTHLCIVGNPPYINVKRGFYDDTYKEKLESRYKSAVKQWDSYALFLERCTEWKPSALSLIVPKPILTNTNQAAVRQVLVERGLSFLIDVGSVFVDAAVETVIIGCTSNSPDIIRTAKYRQGHLQWLGGFRRSVGQSGDSWNLYSNPRIESIFSKIQNFETRLSGLLERPVLRGVEVGKSALKKSSAKGYKTCYAGAEVQSELPKKPEGRLKPSWRLKSKFKEEALYEGPKVLVRRVANSILAATDYSDSLCLNTLYVVRPGNGFECEVITALLNSEAMQFWFKYKYVNDDALFPYIRTNQLSDAPFPISSSKDLPKALRSLIHSEMGKSWKSDKLQKQIFALYGISSEEVELIRAHLNSMEKAA